MFKYLGKAFFTVEDARKAEKEKTGKTVSHKAMYKTLEELRRECVLAGRKQGRKFGYTPVSGDWEAVRYDERRQAALEILERMDRSVIDIHTGCF